LFDDSNKNEESSNQVEIHPNEPSQRSSIDKNEKIEEVEDAKEISKTVDSEATKSEAVNNETVKNEEQEIVTLIEEPKPKIAAQTINKSNWHLALSYSGIEGNGLQVLLNSLAEYDNKQLIIRHLPKVVHLLTDSLNVSMIQYLQDYFDDTNLTITLKTKEELINTPRDRKVKRHEDDIESFCKELTENLCVAKLQSELGAVIDKQTIDVKSEDF